MISVVVLTKNEEQDLPDCLESVRWCDDVHVLDSFSTDRTAEIARSYGANFAERRFDTYSAQRNAALATLPFRHAWVLFLDADERPTLQLAQEMLEAVRSAPEQVNGFQFRRRDFLHGTWLKHAQLSPWYIRLTRSGKARYVRAVNEMMEVDGLVKRLKSPLDHFPFSKGMAHWLAKHNIYSDMEAQLIVSGQDSSSLSLKTALFGKDFHARRVAQKALFYRLPGRPLLKWCYMIFVRGAILDGRAGIEYANLQAIYEYFIVLKSRELTRQGRKAKGQGISF